MFSVVIERERVLEPLIPYRFERQPAYRNLSNHFDYEDGNSVFSRNLTIRYHDHKT
jgi:hypothetical protein